MTSKSRKNNSADKINRLELTKFISISIDVVGSTEAKKKINCYANKWDLDLTKLYEQFARRLLSIEHGFLELLYVIQNENNNAFELERFFLIKTIGDEWWYAYNTNDLDNFEIGQHARHIFKALLAIQSKEPCCLNIPSSWSEDEGDLYIPEDLLRLKLPIKITCDFICGIDIGQGRDENVSGLLARLSGEKYVTVGDENYNKLMKNLGGVTIVLNKEVNKATIVTRSDYIGMEVDRFFRLSGKAEEGRVLIGNQLIKLLDIQDSLKKNIKLNEGWNNVKLLDKREGGGYIILADDIFVNRINPELKGIGLYQAAICTDKFASSNEKIWKANK